MYAVVIVQLFFGVYFFVRPSHFSQVSVCCILLKHARIVKARAAVLPQALSRVYGIFLFNFLNILSEKKKMSLLMLFFFLSFY